LSIGGDAPKPKTAKVLSIGVPAPPKDAPKNEPTKEDTAPAEKETPTDADAGAKATATKAIEKTGETTKAAKSASGKTSPTPSSGRSSPTRAATGKPAVVRDVDAVVVEQSADVDEETLKEIYGKEHVNVIFLGHVDAGKSTLGGSILYSTGMVDDRTSK
jgi:peptide chain release factor subunit 3